MSRRTFQVFRIALTVFAFCAFYCYLARWSPPPVEIVPDTLLDIATPLVAEDAPTSATRWAPGPPIGFAP